MGDDSYFLFLKPDNGDNLDYSIMLQINMTMYALINWFWVTGLVTMLFSIRNVADQTMTKWECFLITILWTVSLTWMHVLNWLESYHTCIRTMKDHDTLSFVYRASYWTGIVRNLLTMGITSYYSWKAYRNEEYTFATLGEAHEATSDFVLQDFNLLLSSFIPRHCFEQYLR